MTEDEKRQMASLDSRTRSLLERTEALGEGELAQMHGQIQTNPTGAKPGDQVRLKPRERADAFDLILSGKLATVASIEQDFEGNVHLCVTINDDPGQDLGAAGMPGHRFFFRPHEVESIIPNREGA
jgi:hydrogenase maturation protease